MNSIPIPPKNTFPVGTFSPHRLPFHPIILKPLLPYLSLRAQHVPEPLLKLRQPPDRLCFYVEIASGITPDTLNVEQFFDIPTTNNALEPYFSHLMKEKPDEGSVDFETHPFSLPVIVTMGAMTDTQLEKYFDVPPAAPDTTYQFNRANEPFALVFVSLQPSFFQDEFKVEITDELSKVKRVNEYVRSFNEQIQRTRTQEILFGTVANQQYPFALRLVLPTFYSRGKGGFDEIKDTMPPNGSYPICGPGGLPMPVDDEWYDDTLPAFYNPDGAGPKPVQVYILDSLYPHTEWERYDNKAKAHPALKRWWEKANIVRINRKPSDTLEHSAKYNLANRFSEFSPIPKSEKEEATRQQFDHGPFIADIIYRLAPQASLTLVETINARNVGTLEVTALVIEWLRNQLLHSPEIPKLVNLSFVFDIPSYGHEIQRVLNEILSSKIDTAEKASDSTQSTSELIQDHIEMIQWLMKASETWAFLENPTTRRLMWNMFKRIIGLIQDIPNTLVIAAAGNNSYEGVARPAELPSALDGVIGVEALAWDMSKQGLSKASYSNQADSLPAESIAAFGGGRRKIRFYKTNAEGERVHETMFISDGGVIGPYLNDQFDYLEEFPKAEVKLQAMKIDKVNKYGASRFAVTPHLQKNLNKSGTSKVGAGVEEVEPPPNEESVAFAEINIVRGSEYAMWSGTSFAAARVTGKIAAFLQSEKGSTIKSLWDVLPLLPQDITDTTN